MVFDCCESVFSFRGPSEERFGKRCWRSARGDTSLNACCARSPDGSTTFWTAADRDRSSVTSSSAFDRTFSASPVRSGLGMFLVGGRVTSVPDNVAERSRRQRLRSPPRNILIVALSSSLFCNHPWSFSILYIRTRLPPSVSSLSPWSFLQNASFRSTSIV